MSPDRQKQQLQAGRSPFPLVDLVKVVAAQLIVLHHLAWYGPMSDVAATLAPFFAEIFAWLANHARHAVAAFLATAGFLAAQSLQPTGLPLAQSPLRLILRRYLRLVLPFAVAMLFAIVCASLARQWMTHASIGSPPGIAQVMAHLALVHGLLGYESLSAGVWYVAIDFQLYSLLVLLIWLSGKLSCRLASADFLRMFMLALLACASLFYFNRDAGWDSTALYFFGAYALGVAGAWLLRSPVPIRWVVLMTVLVGLALLIDFRPRIAIALLVALGLITAHLSGWRGLQLPWLAPMSRSSYALFLVHFPFCLLVNAGFQLWMPADPFVNLLGVLLAWLGSNVLAGVFQRQIEVRLYKTISI